jgi:hypothetical protein
MPVMESVFVNRVAFVARLTKLRYGDFWKRMTVVRVSPRGLTSRSLCHEEAQEQEDTFSWEEAVHVLAVG